MLGNVEKLLGKNWEHFKNMLICLENVGKCWEFVGKMLEMFGKCWEHFGKCLEDFGKFRENLGKFWKTRESNNRHGAEMCQNDQLSSLLGEPKARRSQKVA